MRALAVFFILLSACGRGGSPGVDASEQDAGVREDAGRDAGSDGGTDAGFDGGTDAGFDAGVPDVDASYDAGGGTTTTIRVHYAGRAGAIMIRGESGPLSWTTSVAAIEESPGLWVYRTDEITASTEWKPLLGSEWARGPNFHVDPGDTIDVAPHFVAGNGRVIELDPTFDSVYITSPRTVWAYLPAGYDENTAATYPVVYMHDGTNLFDPALAFGGVEWQVDEAMNAAAESGRCEDGSWCANDGECGGAVCDTFHDAIVIGVGATAARIDEYTPTMDPSYPGSGDADQYLRALIEELKPIVDAGLRTRTGAEDTAILGSSLGGLVSVYAGVRHPDVFGRVGAMSPSTWWDSRVILDEVASIPSLPLRASIVYVDSGDSGPSMDGAADTAELASTYRSVGYVEGTDFHYVLAPGHAHTEYYWAIRLPGALAFMLGPREERP